MLEQDQHQSIIQKSWQRCRDIGLDHDTKPIVEKLEGSHLKVLVDEHDKLIQTTHHQVLPCYENLLVNSSSQVVLADKQGTVLQQWGKPSFANSKQALFRSGISWQEQCFGTNAIGTALKTKTPVQIQQDEHFLSANRFMNGAAAPIFGIDRQLVGVIDISSDSFLPQSHTLGMVRLMSQAVENHLISSFYQRLNYCLTFNTSPDNIDSQWSALMVINHAGCVIAVNRRAEQLLEGSIVGEPIDRLFGLSLTQLESLSQAHFFQLQCRQECRFYAQLHIPEHDRTSTSVAFRKPKIAKPNKSSLEQLKLGDPIMDKAVFQASRVMDKDIPILVRGETGVGKEVFVRALHNSSRRSESELVTINCAAIPKDLVESELFGYAKGAFTGSNTKGHIGLIRQAAGGTLFLDEIGDMPLSVQARLLRVLQEKQVTPLGSVESFTVDFKLITATHKDLKTAVTEGSFRQDLYYRICGLQIVLPSLKQRLDKRRLIENIFDKLSSHARASLSEEVMSYLLVYHWPGNIRQLRSILEVALALAIDEQVELEHLELDIIEYVDQLNLGATDIDGNLDQERDAFAQIYFANRCNVSLTAKQLHVSRNTVYKRLRSFGINAKLDPEA
ncbi:sigma-54-dependent Fis family transcriptional regulator [Alginatibacterium sediminis]|uniref:Sigma-54-dependent Fis family transcriptional regulator n=1 Tax=Alginatibacterium sediminis TaxID=2164068 RepID=A0A420ELE0_9ALTE|nr:sigma-54-dependent Fis family transcriptional regulator [Alginatibacterium sediminis]